MILAACAGILSAVVGDVGLVTLTFPLQAANCWPTGAALATIVTCVPGQIATAACAIRHDKSVL